ncbi:AP endonuclease [Sporormia fimetaria CBS 119925]|uniref:Apurinic-apyrimidinic endonuclease 1 n=1 Tax=Sporormia fimetaria CBS 119925 TaxID=1340428 RepID=A0A6A6V3T6_9PLEO|nr:AP endonuclease [Sporormia fimetaria CBS 119925]
MARQAAAVAPSEIEDSGTKRKAETVATRTSKRTRKTVTTTEVPNGDVIVEAAPVRKRETPVKADEGLAETFAEAPSARKRKPRVKVEEETVKSTKIAVVDGESGTTEIQVKRKRQRKQKEEDLTPLAERTVDSKLRVGAHVSIAGGLHNAVTNLVHIGSNAFALFLKSQRKWENPPINTEHADLFIEACKQHSIEPGTCCLPHGSYLVNLAHPDEARKKQAYKSFHDDLTRCHRLGIKLYNFHPGNSNACGREEGIRLIAENINQAHQDPKTGDVMPVLETMATLGNTIGGTFQDLADIIKLVEDKTRIGVCLDTCHVFAAGYDLRTPETFVSVMKEFDEIIGLKYLKALHVNDSKAPLASYRDLHARIGTGYLGLRAFHNLVNDERLHGLPMILETPIEVDDGTGKKVEDKSIWAREIKMLESLVGMDVESEHFKKWEKELADEGAGERERIGEQVERKKKKDAEKMAPKKRKSKKKVEIDEEDEEDSA